MLHENNHWATVFSPTERATSAVNLYDSLQKERLNKADIAYNHKPEQRTYNQSVMSKHLLAQLETKQWHRSHNKQNELNTEKKLHIASNYIANVGCHSSKMIRRKTKGFSWRFVQFAENGTTRDVKIFLWPFFMMKKSYYMEMLEM